MSSLESKSVNHALWLIAASLIWTVLTFSSLAWNYHHESQESIRLASNEAEAHFNKDMAIRSWSASHGGVYVPVDERTAPNLHLSHIPERDITTPSGKNLTLMNPAYMLSQMMNDYSKLYGVKGKITSFPDKLLNPGNMPDQWEVDALNSFEKGIREAKARVDVDGVPHLRLMRPIFIKQGCLKCHAFQGYKLGDLRGGFGVSVSMVPYLEKQQASLYNLYITYGFFWVIGLITFAYLFNQAKAREQGRRRTEEEMFQLNDKLEKLSFLDGLTSIANRRSFNRAFDREWSRCRRNQKPLSLVMIDIDLFKDYNDHYGHQQGDECLKQVAQTMGMVLKRAGDMVARYGGEEFVLLLPEIEFEQATQLAEECRNKILDKNIDHQASKVIDVVSISLGVCTTVPTQEAEASTLLVAADKALYRAKENGRNRVESSKL